MANHRAPTYASLRVNPELRARLDAVTDRMATRASGLRPTMASVLLVAVDRGLPAVEAEQGIGIERESAE